MKRLPRKPTLLREIFGKVDGLQALASRTFEHVLPAGGCVQVCLVDEIHTYLHWLALLLKFKPQKTVGSQSEPVGLALDGREFNVSEHLNRNGACRFGQVEVDKLREAREIGDAKDPLILVLSHVAEDFAVRRIEEPHAPAAENVE